MADLSKIMDKPSEPVKSNGKHSVLNSNNITNNSFNINIFDIAVLILSVFSIISDLCTDLVLVVQYSIQGYKTWALGTFLLIFFPSVIVQFFSLRWHIVDKTSSVLLWVLHFCMLGIIHRYVHIIQTAFTAYKSKNLSGIQKVYIDQSDLCMLHLFESFLESAPQLVLQIYVIAMLHEWRFWTGLSALASLLSLAWALAAYTKAQRRARPNKNSSNWPGLLLQAAWRTGMLTARISTLVLGAYCFGNYIFLLIMLHWIGMTIWIIYQKTDFCETYWEEKIYNAVVGVIYCFCFFNLQEGPSRYRALAFYLVIVLQNLTCLTIFLTWFADSAPKLAVSGFIAIVGGTLLGALSMLLYYRFFHPSGPIKLFFGGEETNCQAPPSSSYSSLTMRSLKGLRSDNLSNENAVVATQPYSEQLLSDETPLSDSVIIIEENLLDDTDEDIKILQNWITEDCNINQSKTPVENNAEKEAEKGDAYKRRAICSSFDLVKLIEPKIETDTDLNGSLKLTESEETSSEILSAHDYENLCAVNIARERWGLRSWRGYSDIETCLHDDSVVHDRRLDTLTSTTSSDRSGNTITKENERTRQDDYIDAIAEDLAQCESEASSDDILEPYSIESLTVSYSLGTLDPILEELEEMSTSTECTDIKIRNGSVSTLVATIDEIRRNTPTQNRYHLEEKSYDDFSSSLDIIKSPPLNWKKVSFASKLLTFPENNTELPVNIPNVNKKIEMTVKKPAIVNFVNPESVEEICTKDSLEKNREVLFLSKEPHKKEQLKTENNNKENILTVASKINHWNNILSSQSAKKIPDKVKISPTKRIIDKEGKSVFLKKVLTPPKFSTFQRKKES